MPVLPVTGYELLTEKRAETFRRKYQLAHEFLNGADYYLHFKAYGLASFSLHQAAENALIAIIRAVLGYRLTVHNVARLLRLTQMFTPELKSVFDLDSSEGSQLFALLQQAYNDPRYREDFTPDEASVKLLFQLVSLLLERVKAIYEKNYGELS